MTNMNLILVFIDSLRQDHVGAYGNPWIKTPNLDRFASESVRFNRAYPEAMPTLPFRNGTFTGRRVFPFNRWKAHLASWPVIQIQGSGKDWNVQGWSPLNRDETPMAEYFLDQGYRTALATDVFHYYYPGMNFHRGFQSWEWIRGQEWDCWKTNLLTHEPEAVEKYFPGGVDLKNPKVWEVERYHLNTDHRQSEEDYFAPRVFRAATKWLEQNYRTEQFFLCVDCFDPHEPWDPPPYYRDLYDPGYKGKEVIMPLYTDNASGYLSESELKHLAANYAGEVSMVDHWFGFFMNKVKLLGLDKNSLIVVISDHGLALGDKNFTGKMPFGLMPCLLDLVLFIRHPEGAGAGQECDAFVQNHDILPTACNLMGVDIPEWVDGKDIWPVVEGKREGVRNHASSIFKGYAWVRDEEYAMTMKTDKTDVALYD
ncbi:MAG: sulfatase, partial [Deltaproteobacteria bacterium]|nr:sulfatase [Deltaproteobacteria bacterium]